MSFQITLKHNRRAAARFIGDVRRAILKAYQEEQASSGLTQTEIARKLEVHRSVINRELRGSKDMTLGRVGELAWALGRKASFELPKIVAAPGANMHKDVNFTPLIVSSSAKPVVVDTKISVRVG